MTWHTVNPTFVRSLPSRSGKYWTATIYNMNSPTLIKVKKFDAKTIDYWNKTILAWAYYRKTLPRVMLYMTTHCQLNQPKYV
jgi:hypothetical protein